jgi:hypothetical protein
MTRAAGLRRVCLLFAVLVMAGCGTVAAVRPLRRGESHLALSLGGPVCRVAGIDVPLPYAAVRYRYGLNDRAGLYVGGHLLTAGFGVIGIDAGYSHHFLRQRGWVPALGASAGFAAFVEPGGGEAFFPQLDLVASYRLSGRFLCYFGSQSMYQFSARPNVVLAPFLGTEARLGRRFNLNLEAKWYAPTEETKPRNVDYRLPIGGRGAVGFVLGVGYGFGRAGPSPGDGSGGAE